MKTTFLSLLIMASVFAQAQTEATTSKVPGRTAFYAEFGGPGILLSANIDPRFKPSIYGLGFRGGHGFVTADEEINNSPNGFSYETRSVVTIPLQVNYIFGKQSAVHTFEVGGGLIVGLKKLDILNYTITTNQTFSAPLLFCIAASRLKEDLYGGLDYASHS